MKTYPAESHRGQACFRLPEAIYRMLQDLRPPGATPWEYGDCRLWVPQDSFSFGLVKLNKMRMPHGDQIVDGVVLTDWGRRVAGLVYSNKIGRQTRPPLIPIRDLLAVCSPEVRATLAADTPLPRSGVGAFFEAVGVLASDPMGGSTYIRTGALRDAVAELNSGRDGPVLVDDFLSPDQMVFLRQCFAGIHYQSVELDGRSIKPMGLGYMGLIRLHEDGVYRVISSMKDFAALAMVQNRNPVELFGALPEIDKVWIATGLTAHVENAHPYLLHKMGWLYKRGRAWSLTKLAKDQLEGWKEYLRGAPVELMLPPDLPNAPDDFTILDPGPEPDGPDDPFDMLDLRPSNPCAEVMLPETKLPDGINPYTGYPSAPPPRIDTVQGRQVVTPAKDDSFDIL